MKNVLIVNDEMVFGGVAKVLVNMLKEIDFDDVNIDILILHPHGEMLKDIPSNYNILPSTSFFEVVDLSRENALNKNIDIYFRRIWLYILMKIGLIKYKIKKERKKIINKQYDVEIAYKEGFCTVFVANGDSKKKVNWVHVDYTKNNYSINHMPLVKKMLKNIDVEVAQSYDAAKAYKQVFDLTCDFEVIHNFIDREEIKRKSKEIINLGNSFNIVSVGRLHYQKAYLRMMDVLARLKEYDFHFYIVGDGEERKQVEEKIATLGLSDKVTLVGYNENPYKYVAAADLFICPSLYESAPTVVYEALAVGETPILACDVAGVNEQLNNGEYGIICENSEDGIYNSLKKILDNPEILESYKEKMKGYTNSNKESINKIHDLFTK